ncbi:MAG TPA: hypothetical protein VFA39_15820 [Steroidobacteraceae bacterium]|nr:hypothetical protein [Steroidobacteraceae bacterium]
MAENVQPTVIFCRFRCGRVVTPPKRKTKRNGKRPRMKTVCDICRDNMSGWARKGTQRAARYGAQLLVRSNRMSHVVDEETINRYIEREEKRAQKGAT